MKLYVDLATLQLIEGPGFRNPVSSLRFKRGDSARLEVAFLTGGTTPAHIGDPATLEIKFGVKPRGRYDVGYLVHTADWTLPDPGAESPTYLCSPSFNTVELDSAMQVGSSTGSELSEITLMGEITWREGTGDPTSTRTFTAVVENDVNRGTEGVPTEAEPPYPAPDSILTDDLLDQPLGVPQLDGAGLVPGDLLSGAVRFDAAQALTAPQKEQARSNVEAFRGGYEGTAYLGGDLTGDPRGANALDVQSLRALDSMVADGSAASAFGHNNTASGARSSAFGYGNDADGADTLAAGCSNLAQGDKAAAIGYDNTTSGNEASACGYDNTAGLRATAIGHSNLVAGADASGVGRACQASGQKSSGFGYGNIVSGANASAFGYGNSVSGYGGSCAFGYQNDVAAIGSGLAFGLQNDVDAAYSGAFGMSNLCQGSLSQEWCFGSNNQISNGGNHCAFGINNTLSGNYNGAAFGYDNDSTANYAFAFGGFNTASGSDSSAFGLLNTASGTYSSALGYDNEASAYNSSAVGRGNTASGPGSSAVGKSNTASGYYGGASAFGYYSQATGSYSSAVGNRCNASATEACAFGAFVEVGTNYVSEFGSWSWGSRGASIRCHGQTGMVAMTVQQRDSAFGALGNEGDEADNNLGTGMAALRIHTSNGNCYLDWNDGGTIRTITLGDFIP